MSNRALSKSFFSSQVSFSNRTGYPRLDENMGGQDKSYRGIWSRQNVVPMLTLDTLIEHFGMPHFIKIDVEGFEEKVLSGLSAQPPLISFEFTAAFLTPVMRCLEMEV